MSPTAVIPPHPGLDTIVGTEELKRQCPAFSEGCPYAKVNQSEEAGLFQDVTKCPAFQKGCPFSNKSKEEIAALITSIPKEHPVMNINNLPSHGQGVVLVQMLNQFLSATELSKIFVQDQVQEPEPAAREILADPQLAAAMREGTKAAHKAAENSLFTKRFLKGEINRDEYGQYILSLYSVYRSMEALLEEHKDNPTIKVIYFPQELNRQEALLKDIEYFYGKELAAELTKPSNTTQHVRQYVEAMEAACKIDPALLVAHSYSRYLGDLSGGQILAKRLKKHVLGVQEGDGDWDTLDGLEFYHFANIGNQVEFKNVYRECLNAAPVDAYTRDLIVKEAVKSFELNIGLFDEIQQLSEQDKLPLTLLSPKKTQAAKAQTGRAQVTQAAPSNPSIPVIVAGVTATLAIAAALYYRYSASK